MKLSDLPNLISFLRILLVVPVTVFIVKDWYGWALVLFVVAGLSDGLDGFLARRFGWQSQLGAVLDPMGDKLLMMAVYFSLGLQQHLPWWLVAVVLARDIIIVTGALVYHAIIEQLKIQPLLISKVNTVAQILLVVVLLYSLTAVAITVPSSFLDALIIVVFLTTVASGLGYVFAWSRRARKAVNRRNNS